MKQRPWFIWPSPVLVVIALALSLTSMLNPSFDSPQIALLNVAPTTISGAGPRVWLGLFNSCSQPNKSQEVICLDKRWDVRYDLSVLPQNAPSFVLDTPPDLPRAFAAFSTYGLLPLVMLFQMMVCWLPCQEEGIEKLFLKSQIILWLTLVSGLIGGLNLWVLKMYYEKTCQHFNVFVALQGPGGPKLVASLGKGFQYAYLCYAILGAFLIVTLAQTHFAVGGGILKQPAPIQNPPLVFKIPDYKPFVGFFKSIKFSRPEVLETFVSRSSVDLTGLHYDPTLNPILFYNKDEPHYGFTNFSPHPVRYNGTVYKTSEHLFQALKFWPDEDMMRIIRNCPTSMVALKTAGKSDYASKIRPGWIDQDVNVQVMRDVLQHKFDQHESLRRELLGTGYAQLIEDSARDNFWGRGPNGNGTNQLGICLMELRTQLRQAQSS